MKKRTYLTEAQINEFKNFLFQWKSENEIKEMYSNCYSPSQIISIFVFENSCALSEKSNSAESIFRREKEILIKLLKKFIPYLEADYKKYLSTSQFWKIRFCHLDKTEDEVHELVKTQLQNWALDTHKKRREQEHYNPKQTLSFWKDKGFSEETALEKLNEFKRENSPFSVYFWIKRGLSYEDAVKKTKEYNTQGGRASCNSQNSISVSKLETMIFEEINKRLSRRLVSQFCIKNKFVYDFCDPKLKKIVEINGTFWHADPRVYQDVDAILFNGLSVKEIRIKDEVKLKHALDNGYQVFIVWEIDWHANKEQTMQKIVNFLMDNKNV
jgi:hypothetical protein